MCDLILILHEVQLLIDLGVVTEFLPARLEEPFDDVLDSPVSTLHAAGFLTAYSHIRIKNHLGYLALNMYTM